MELTAANFAPDSEIYKTVLKAKRNKERFEKQNQVQQNNQQHLLN